MLKLRKPTPKPYKPKTKQPKSCSKQRSLNAMRMLDKNELEDILKKEGKAELVCEFCKNKYLINYEEIKEMIKSL